MNPATVLLLIGLGLGTPGDPPASLPPAFPASADVSASRPRAAERLRPSALHALLVPAAHPAMIPYTRATDAVGENTALPWAAPARSGSGVAFMAAGGALFLAGAIIGGEAGTLVMVAGAGIGAYGVYLYFR